VNINHKKNDLKVNASKNNKNNDLPKIKLKNEEIESLIKPKSKKLKEFYFIKNKQKERNTNKPKMLTPKINVNVQINKNQIHKKNRVPPTLLGKRDRPNESLSFQNHKFKMNQNNYYFQNQIKPHPKGIFIHPVQPIFYPTIIPTMGGFYYPSLHQPYIPFKNDFYPMPIPFPNVFQVHHQNNKFRNNHNLVSDLPRNKLKNNQFNEYKPWFYPPNLKRFDNPNQSHKNKHSEQTNYSNVHQLPSKSTSEGFTKSEIIFSKKSTNANSSPKISFKVEEADPNKPNEQNHECEEGEVSQEQDWSKLNKPITEEIKKFHFECESDSDFRKKVVDLLLDLEKSSLLYYFHKKKSGH
jgi:hypothetical protein